MKEVKGCLIAIAVFALFVLALVISTLTAIDLKGYKYRVTYTQGKFSQTDYTNFYTVDSQGGCHYNGKVIYGSYEIEENK